MKKKLLASVIAVLLFIFCIGMTALAQEDVVVSLQIDNPVMQVNGVRTQIDPGRETAPVVTNGRTLVPIRAIVEAFGGTVGWNGDTQTL